MEVDSEELRAELHRAVDAVFTRIADADLRRAMDGIAELIETGLIVEFLGAEGEHADFEYVWPDRTEEYFKRVHAYSVRSGSTSAEVIVGETQRLAWGEDRGRVVVFERITDQPSRWYPWTEFVETDDGRFAATIPDPARPRASLKDGDPLPPQYATLNVARADRLFGSIQDGPSLRLVLNRDEEEAMIRHGHHVARLRGRV